MRITVSVACLSLGLGWVLALGGLARADGPVRPAQPPVPEADAGAAAPRPAAPPPAAPVLLPALTAAPAAPCGAPCRDACDPCAPRWELSLEGGLGLLESPEGLLGVQPPPGDALDWGGVDYAPTFAGRVRLAVRAGARWGFAVGAMHWGKADDEVDASGFAVIRPAPGGLPSLSRPLAGTLSSELTLWDLRAGGWCEWGCSPCLTMVAGVGVRVASLDETSRADLVTTDLPTVTGSIESEVDNDLLLAEASLGLRWAVGATSTLGVTVTGMLGGSGTDITVRDENVLSAGAHAATRGDEDTAYGLQVDLLAAWRVNKDFSLTAGYSLLWLDGIQRGPAAIDLGQTATGAVQASYTPESYLAHAFLLGISFDF